MSEWVWVWAGYGITAATWTGYVVWALLGSRSTDR
jgi:hypothetical protein